MLSKDAIALLITRQLQHEEGYREFCYNDATGEEIKLEHGNITVGIGFNLSAGCPLDLAQIIAAYFINKADAELTKDLDFYEKLDEVRKCALIDMAFNMGVHGVEAFKNSLNLIAQGFYKNAAEQMRKSQWYVKFTRRAEPICIEMETGVWQPIAA